MKSVATVAGVRFVKSKNKISYDANHNQKQPRSMKAFRLLLITYSNKITNNTNSMNILKLIRRDTVLKTVERSIDSSLNEFV